MACIYKINGKTFSTTNEIQNYIDSDEFISEIAKQKTGISNDIRNILLTQPKSKQPTKTNIQNEKTNEVREVEKGRGEKGNEGGQQSRKENGQETNVQENEVLTEGGVKTPKSEISSKPKPENVKAIEEAMTKKSGTIKNEIIKEAADPTEVKKILDNLDSIKSKLAGLTTKDGDSVFSEECKWG